MSALRNSLVGLAALAGVGAAARPVAHRAVFPGAESPIPATEMLARMVPGARRIEYASADGTRLAAMWVPAREGRATAVYFHATNQAAADARWFARDLAARGVGVCVPEHRGYGGLAGEPSIAAVLTDAEASLAACPAAGRRVLVGRSLGAGIAAEMARRGHGQALVLVSPFTSLADAAAPFGWALGEGEDLDVRAAVRGLGISVTVVHGTEDLLIPFRMGQELASLSQARFVPLAGAGHNDLFLGDARRRLIEEIERAALAAP